MEPKVYHKFVYGLFLLTAQQDGRDNGCIINTAVQVADDPPRISVSVIKENLTCQMIAATGQFNLSSLTEGHPLLHPSSTSECSQAGTWISSTASAGSSAVPTALPI